MIEIGLKLISVDGEMDQYKINIGSLVSTGYTWAVFDDHISRIPVL